MHLVHSTEQTFSAEQSFFPSFSLLNELTEGRMTRSTKLFCINSQTTACAYFNTKTEALILNRRQALTLLGTVLGDLVRLMQPDGSHGTAEPL